MSLYKKKVSCPVCQKAFETMKVKSSKLRVESTDSDFFKKYKDITEHPIKYEVVMCPNCGYAALEKHFSSISKRGIAAIKENISHKWTKQDYTHKRDKTSALTVYKFALYSAELMKKSKVELGGICLRISWINRLYGDDAEEKKYLDMTLKLYERAYIEEDLFKEGTSELTVAYLIGDLNARLGNSREALKWMNQVLFNKSISENKALEKNVREQIPVLKLKLKEN